MKIVDCLPTTLLGLKKYLDKLQEIRLVVDKPVRVVVDGKRYYFCQNGLQNNPQEAVYITAEQIGEVLQKACKNSIYAFENQLVNGYLTLQDGTRIGCSGMGVVNKHGEVYFSYYHSLCIRLAKMVEGCSRKVLRDVSLANNFIVVGKPGFGKTTFLRDMVEQASKTLFVVVADERGELTLVDGFAKACSCDTLQFVQKQRAFEIAVRSLSPNVVVCDEIALSDVECVKNTINSGVNVYASLHARSFTDAKQFCEKHDLNFDYFVILTEFGGKTAKLLDKFGNHITL